MPARSISVTAPAKINLYLGVSQKKDERGYHRVDSVMTTLGLVDELRMTPSSQLAVTTVPGADFPMEENTAFRAVTELAREFDRDPGLSIRIIKRIPLRAGLGGPSTDAAAALVGACHLWGIDPHDGRVVRVARSIGADVPFFLYGPPAYFIGAGDVMAQIYEPLDGVDVVLVRAPSPTSGVTAAEAYRRFDADPQDIPPVAPMLDALAAGDSSAVVRAVANNLAPAARSIASEIDEVLAWLRAWGSVSVAEVSGSGSCCFAICDGATTAQAIAHAAQAERGWWSCATKMEKSGPIVIEN